MSLRETIPVLYFDRITLSYASVRGERLENNPHIDHEREPENIYNARTGKIERSVELPNYKEKVNGGKSLQILLDLVIPSNLKKNMPSEWVNKADLNDYFKVRVVQCTDANLAARIISANSLFIENINVSGEAGKTVMKEYSFKELYYSLLGQSSNYRLPFTIKFEIPTGNVSYLSYFTVAYLDLISLSKKYNMQIPEGSSFVEGRMISEVVLNNGEVSSVSYCFVKENQEVWEGDLIKDANTWKTPQGEALSLVTISNNKIQDFRYKEHLERMALDFSPIYNSLLNNRKIKVLSNDYMDLDRKEKCINNFSVSRDSMGRARFVFAIDTKQIVENYSLYGKVFNESAELKNLLRIMSLKVYRIRVSNNDGAYKDQSGVSYFSEETDPPELVAYSCESVPGVFQNAERVDSVTQRKTGFIKELFLDVENYGLRHFTGIDFSIQSVTYGLYWYMVELVVEDLTQAYIEEKMHRLNQELSNLEEYSAMASNPVNYDATTGRFYPWFSNLAETKYFRFGIENAPWIRAITEFLKVVKFFYDRIETESVLKFMFLISNPRTGTNSGIATVIDIINTFIMEINNSIGVKKFGTNTVWNKGKATDSSVKGSELLKSFQIIGFSEDSFDSDVIKHIGYDYLSLNEDVSEKNDDGLRVISGVDFISRTNKENAKYFKYSDDVLDMQNLATQGSITNYKYSYFSPSVVELGTGASVVLSNVEALQNFERAELVRSIILDKMDKGSISRGSESKQALSDSGKAKGMIAKKNTEKISLSGATMTTYGSELLSTVTSQGTIKSNAYTSTTSNFNKEDSSIRTTANNGDINETIEQPKAEDYKEGVLEKTENPNLYRILAELSNAIDDLGKKCSKVDSNTIVESVNIFNPNSPLSTSLNNLPTVSRQMEVARLPNQLKSLALCSVAAGVSTIDEGIYQGLRAAGNSAVVQMNFGLISRVEILRRYIVIKGTTFLRGEKQTLRPVWELFTNELAVSLKGSRYLCRIVPYENSALGILRSAEMDLPVYNDYFILALDQPSLTGFQVGPNVAQEYQKTVEDSSNNMVAVKAITSSNSNNTEAPLASDPIRTVSNSNEAGSAKSSVEQSNIVKDMNIGSLALSLQKSVSTVSVPLSNVSTSQPVVKTIRWKTS